MPTLEWIGKDKVVNHHQEVPYRVLERQYSYDEAGQHAEDNGSENMIIHGDNLEALKAQGVVRHIGLYTHTPALAREVLDTGLADMMMFSINPSYDYQHGEYANGSATERMALYRRCEAEGVGISVMKAFAGGQLLDARTSPFGQALTEYHCIQYALDKPGGLTGLPGFRDRADLERVLGFLRAGEAERDYSGISSLTPRDAEGTCVYCNHCQPCPAGIQIGLANKYYDLARLGAALAADH